MSPVLTSPKLRGGLNLIDPLSQFKALVRGLQPGGYTTGKCYCGYASLTLVHERPPNEMDARHGSQNLVSHANWRIDSVHPCGMCSVTLDKGSSAINLILNLPGSFNVSYGTHVSEMNPIN